MAHLRTLGKPACIRCHKPGCVELFDYRNVSHGAFCLPCGDKALCDMVAEETRDIQRGTPRARYVPAPPRISRKTPEVAR